MTVRSVLLLGLWAAASPAVAGTVPNVNWVDWTSVAPNTDVLGTLDLNGTTVDVTYSGERSFVQTNGGTNYWVPSAPYISATVPNAPPDSDIIALHLATSKTLTFSEPVTNPLFAVVSLNGNGYRFDRDFTILSFGAGYWGNGTLTKQVTTQPGGAVTYDLIGSGEPHGVIQFIGTFDTVTWDSLSNENWNGFSIAVEALAADVPPEIEVHDGTTVGDPLLVSGDTTPLDLGNAVGATSIVRTLTIENTGLGPLNFDTVEVTGVDAAAFTLSTLPPAIAAGATVQLDVTFGPATFGVYEATLSIGSDDQDEDPFLVDLIASVDDEDRDGVDDASDVCPGEDDTIDVDGDGVPDGCDLCEGDDASGDADGDLVCDDSEVILVGSPFVYGQPVSFVVSNARPGTTLYLVWSLSQGQGFCNARGVCLDVAPHQLLVGTSTVDPSGTATIVVQAPGRFGPLAAAAPLTAYVQAAWYEPGTGRMADSNVILVPVPAP